MQQAIILFQNSKHPWNHSYCTIGTHGNEAFIFLKKTLSRQTMLAGKHQDGQSDSLKNLEAVEDGPITLPLQLTKC